MDRLLIYRSSTQRTSPQVHFLAVPQCSSRHRDGNTTTATYRNAAAVDYERSFTPSTLPAPLSPQHHHHHLLTEFTDIFLCLNMIFVKSF